VSRLEDEKMHTGVVPTQVQYSHGGMENAYTNELYDYLSTSSGDLGVIYLSDFDVNN
jgi:hypothetical protein